MDPRKIEAYQPSSFGRPFPPFEPLTTNERTALETALRRCLGVSEAMSATDLLRDIRARSIRLSGASALSSSFDLEGTVRQALPPAPRSVVINWYRFDDMDRIDLHDLAQHLRDIWYPSSDDIEVIDPELRWIVSITHDGEVLFLEINDPSLGVTPDRS